jgi:hypothetical protein
LTKALLEPVFSPSTSRLTILVPESAADITVHPSHETAKVKGVPQSKGSMDKLMQKRKPFYLLIFP